jgi:type IV secretion system protein VirB4
MPKRDYYCQSRRGDRLFELGLGEVALALTATSSKADQALIDRVWAEGGHDNFLQGWLGARNIAWATDLIPHLADVEASR